MWGCTSHHWAPATALEAASKAFWLSCQLTVVKQIVGWPTRRGKQVCAPFPDLQWVSSFLMPFSAGDLLGWREVQIWVWKCANTLPLFPITHDTSLLGLGWEEWSQLGLTCHLLRYIFSLQCVCRSLRRACPASKHGMLQPQIQDWLQSMPSLSSRNYPSYHLMMNIANVWERNCLKKALESLLVTILHFPSLGKAGHWSTNPCGSWLTQHH